VCVCVRVLIFRPAEHVLKARVLETLVEYRTPGDKGPWISKLYKNPIAREKSACLCVAGSHISIVSMAVV
jgi:hypothetical protein